MNANHELNVELHIDDLAEFVFVKNVNDAIISLTLDGLENNKDLFYFCLDLFCKGLVRLFGNNNTVSVEDITHDQFTGIQKKLKNAGILVELSIREIHTSEADAPSHDTSYDTSHDISHDTDANDQTSPTRIPVTNIPNIHELPDDLPLKEYCFILQNTTHSYKVTFELCHVQS